MKKIYILGFLTILSTFLMSAAYAADRMDSMDKEAIGHVAVVEKNDLGITIDDFIKRYNLAVGSSSVANVSIIGKGDFRFVSDDSKTVSRLKYSHHGKEQKNDVDFQLTLVPTTDRIKEIKVRSVDGSSLIVNNAIMKAVISDFGIVSATWEKPDGGDKAVYKSREAQCVTYSKDGYTYLQVSPPNYY